MSAPSFDRAFGIHEKALGVRAQRTEILANNLANADTPGFKARDIDFKAVMRDQVSKSSGLPVDRTNDGHLKGRGRVGWDLLYRTPEQPSIDGNTVDPHQENVEFATNAMSYNATFEFLNDRMRGLMNAIKGE